MELSPHRDLDDITVGIHIADGRGIRAFGVNSRMLGVTDLRAPAARTTKVRFELRLNLGPGAYSLGFSVHRGLAHTDDCYIWEEQLLDFEVEAGSDRPFTGMSYLEPVLKID